MKKYYYWQKNAFSCRNWNLVVYRLFVSENTQLFIILWVKPILTFFYWKSPDYKNQTKYQNEWRVYRFSYQNVSIQKERLFYRDQNFKLRHDYSFITAGDKETLTLWRKKHNKYQNVKSVKMFSMENLTWKSVFGETVVTAENDQIYLLNDDLSVRRKFPGINWKVPTSLDFDKRYIVVGYKWVRFEKWKIFS